MTPDRAITLVIEALGNDNPAGLQQAEHVAFARRFAVALNAVGLLHLATDPQETIAVDRDAPTADDVRGILNPDWAAKRTRP